MQFDQIPSASGHVFRREGKRGPVWYAKYRLPDGRQRQRRTRVLVDGRLEFHEWLSARGERRTTYRGVGRIEFLAPPRDGDRTTKSDGAAAA